MYFEYIDLYFFSSLKMLGTYHLHIIIDLREISSTNFYVLQHIFSCLLFIKVYLEMCIMKVMKQFLKNSHKVKTTYIETNEKMKNKD